MFFRNCFSREEEPPRIHPKSMFIPLASSVAQPGETDSNSSLDFSDTESLEADSNPVDAFHASPVAEDSTMSNTVQLVEPVKKQMVDVVPVAPLLLSSEQSIESSHSTSDSESTKMRVSFRENVTIRFFSTDSEPSDTESPSSPGERHERPPLPTETRSRIKKRLLRKRTGSADNVPRHDMQEMLGIASNRRPNSTSPTQRTRKNSIVNASPYLDGFLNRPDDLKLILVNRQVRYGMNHPWTGQVWLYLGGHFFRQGDLKSAEHAFLQAIDCGDGEHPSIESGYVVGEGFANLGVIYYNMKDTAKAVQSLETALSWHETNEVSHDRDPDSSRNVASCLTKLSMACILDASYDKAKRALTHCAYIHERLGSDHQEMAKILERLGMCHLAENELEEAKSCYLKALREKLQYVGSSHVSLVSTYRGIATVHKKMEEYKSAETVLVCAVRIQDAERTKFVQTGDSRKALKMCADMGETLESLGELFKLQGNDEKYVKSLMDAKVLYRNAGLDDKHPKMQRLTDLLNEFHTIQE